jgi:phosphotriesterase-related protein
MIQTVTGPVAPDALGVVLMHEHIITRSPGVAENYPSTYPREVVTGHCVEVVGRLRERYGVQTMVDHSTIELGRDAPLLRAVSSRSGVQIIACTGLWMEPPAYFDHQSAEQAASLFIDDIRVGIAGTDIRAGIVKCSIDRAGLTPTIEKAIRAAAMTHRATGAPISTHTWTGNESGEVVARILLEEGVDMTRVIIGHSGDTEDMAYLERLLATGAWLGLDRFGIEDRLPDVRRVAMLAALCRAGYASRLFVSQDATCWSGRLTPEFKASFRPNWSLWRIFEHILPLLLAEGVSQDDIDTMLIDNPRRFFTPADPY